VRLLGSRYGVAIVLAVLVILTVGVARAVTGPSRPTGTVGAPSAASHEGVTPSDSGLGDDSVASSDEASAPVSRPGMPSPEAVALEFAAAWLHADGVTSAQWLAGMKPHATTTLMQRLSDADPATVPVGAINGPPQTRVRDSELVEVSIPVSTGVLRLRVVFLGERWLVDSVDWERP
jgi:hypothetical protein